MRVLRVARASLGCVCVIYIDIYRPTVVHLRQDGGQWCIPALKSCALCCVWVKYMDLVSLCDNGSLDFSLASPSRIDLSRAPRARYVSYGLNI